VFLLASRILKALDRNGFQPDVKELQKIAGVGPAKAAIVAAADEGGSESLGSGAKSATARGILKRDVGLVP